MNKRTVMILCAAIGLGATLTLDAAQVLVPSAGGGSFSGSLETKVVTGMPYSADVATETVQTLADGNRIVRRTTGRVYRDIDGRVRREDDRPSGSPAVSISDPLAGKTWSLDLDRHTAREMAGRNVVLRDMLAASAGRGGTVSRGGGAGGRVASGGVASGGVAGGGVAGGVAGGVSGGVAGGVSGGGFGGAVARGGVISGGGRGGRIADNRTVETLPNRSIENLLCSGVRRTTIIPAGAIGNDAPIKIVSEEWTSLDLQVLVSTELNDPRSGRVTYTLTNVNRTNPDPALFKVPSDFTIVK